MWQGIQKPAWLACSKSNGIMEPRTDSFLFSSIRWKGRDRTKKNPSESEACTQLPVHKGGLGNTSERSSSSPLTRSISSDLRVFANKQQILQGGWILDQTIHTTRLQWQNTRKLESCIKHLPGEYYLYIILYSLLILHVRNNLLWKMGQIWLCALKIKSSGKG